MGPSGVAFYLPAVRPLWCRIAYRKASVIEVKEILRLWLDGRSLREMTAA